ncbi:hypothetical protein TRFO_20263 [Tritrichomonas foetus]|uniref:Uncharacterized protein n=1 Tax=Tritrichomonas foetus TaxID=1144522 RepID=A0A1J4KKY3_9EUKA|nr:hypothetical protein TRFO_20263 [Tritrichomonas foetus]|eukprot:OHT10452.1 hypothetical protein TRFO_20263 [Tritrichomonas foetus]
MRLNRIRNSTIRKSCNFDKEELMRGGISHSNSFADSVKLVNTSESLYHSNDETKTVLLENDFSLLVPPANIDIDIEVSAPEDDDSSNHNDTNNSPLNGQNVEEKNEVNQNQNNHPSTTKNVSHTATKKRPIKEKSNTPRRTVDKSRLILIDNFDINKYIFKEKTSESFLSGQQAIDQLKVMMAKENTEFLQHREILNVSTKRLEKLSKDLRSPKLKGEIDPIMHNVRFQIASHYYSIEHSENELKIIRSNLYYYGLLFHRISSNPKSNQRTNNTTNNNNNDNKNNPNNNTNVNVNPGNKTDKMNEIYVDMCSFICDVHKNHDPGRGKQFIRNRAAISRLFGTLEPLPPNPCDTVGFMLSQTNKSGRIIQRFRLQVDLFTFPDLDVIADALVELNPGMTKDEVLQVLFEEAWKIRKYPLITRVDSFMIPTISDLVPKVFNPPFLGDEWTMQTFQSLSQCEDWPLKQAVDSLFDVMFEINPFEIAKLFAKTIQLVADAVMVIVNKEASQVEIDFDQLFNLLIVCIFTSGLSDINQQMSYAHQFSEFVDDPNLQFAMTHMEGLCMYFPRINFRKIREDSDRLVKENQKK